MYGDERPTDKNVAATDDLVKVSVRFLGIRIFKIRTPELPATLCRRIGALGADLVFPARGAAAINFENQLERLGAQVRQLKELETDKMKGSATGRHRGFWKLIAAAPRSGVGKKRGRERRVQRYIEGQGGKGISCSSTLPAAPQPEPKVNDAAVKLAQENQEAIQQMRVRFAAAGELCPAPTYNPMGEVIHTLTKKELAEIFDKPKEEAKPTPQKLSERDMWGPFPDLEPLPEYQEHPNG